MKSTKTTESVSESRSGNSQVTVHDITVSDVLSYGYAIYVAGIKEGGVATPNEMLRALAERIVQRIDAAVDQYEPKTQNGLYISRLLDAGLTYARGLERQRKRLDERREAADRTRELQIQQSLLYLTMQGVMRGAGKLLMLGGVVFSMAYWVIGFRIKEGGEGSAISLVLSIGVACAAALVWILSQFWALESHRTKIERERNKKRRKAKIQQREEIRTCREMVLQTIKSAYEVRFQRELPEAEFDYVSALEAHVAVVVDIEDEEPVKPNLLKRMAGSTWKWLREARAKADKVNRSLGFGRGQEKENEPPPPA